MSPRAKKFRKRVGNCASSWLYFRDTLIGNRVLRKCGTARADGKPSIRPSVRLSQITGKKAVMPHSNSFANSCGGGNRFCSSSWIRKDPRTALKGGDS